MAGRIDIRTAQASEKRLLEELQRRASLANPGDREALLANPDAIELPAEQIESGLVFVAEKDGVPQGFSALLRRADGDFDLDGLFVEPQLWRAGIGRALVCHAAAAARSANAKGLFVIGNPHAARFYEAMGFVTEMTVSTRFSDGALMRLDLSR